MDLTGVTSFLVKHTLDEETGILTITFRDSTDTTTLGEVILENVRSRAFFESVLRMEEARYPNGVVRQGFKSIFDLQAEQGTTEFV